MKTSSKLSKSDVAFLVVVVTLMVLATVIMMTAIAAPAYLLISYAVYAVMGVSSFSGFIAQVAAYFVSGFLLFGVEPISAVYQKIINWIYETTRKTYANKFAAQSA